MAVNFFKDQKKGSEIQDWKQELLSPKEEKKKEAVKKVIAAMTIGKDVSVLFTDVLNCMQTHNIELKKLVYLYVMNYAKTQPEKAILAVNTFQKDSSDPNPLIRALAIRTMGCIRLEKISEYLCDPLKACLRDPDPYVRKTAAICVAKLYDISAELVEDRGFLEMLNELISDSNPMVVANAVAALSEIDEVSEKQVFSIDQSNLNKLLLALDVCTEWGQIFILSSLAKYTAHDAREAENICDRVVPRLNHTNAAVVLNTVKVLMVNMEYLENPAPLIAKIGPPLITLLSKEPEIQYVALRNINIILQRQPQILQHEMKIFFCKYNDPIYVKMEKLEIMIMLAQDRNVEQVLAELREYATEVDVDFVRKSVRAIGRCAIKLANAAEKCIQTLLDLIQTKVNYVVQEAIVVIKDIFRKYPNQYESIIGTLCENLETLDEPEAKASLIWIIGEYAERINNADQLLESFLESFADESATVQLQLLTATVKLFLKRPKDTQEMVQKVLNTATQESDNPDLRDRGFIYWRLLSTDPEAAKAVVLSEKPLISDNISTLEDSLLEVLVRNISTLSSVYHRPPEAFVAKMKQFSVYGGRGAEKRKKRDDNEEEDEEGERVAVGGDSNNAPAGSGNLLDLDEPSPATPSGGGGGGARNLLDDEADFFGAGPSASASAAAPSPIPKAVVLQAQQGEGMQVAAVFVRKSGQPHLDLSVTNNSPAPISGIAVQFNKNSSQLAPASQPNLPPIAPGATASCLVPLSLQGPRSDTLTPQIQVAIKNNVKVFYFVINLNLNALFSEDGALARDEYLGMWRSIPDASEKSWVVKSALTPDQMAAKLKQFNIFEIARRQVETASVLYLSLKLEPDRTALLLELTFNNQGAIKIAIRTSQPDWIPIFGHTFNQLIA